MGGYAIGVLCAIVVMIVLVIFDVHNVQKRNTEASKEQTEHKPSSKDAENPPG